MGSGVTCLGIMVLGETIIETVNLVTCVTGKDDLNALEEERKHGYH